MSPSSSWSLYRARLSTLFQGADSRVLVAFWLFGNEKPPLLSSHPVPSPCTKPTDPPNTGLINNILYVILLTAALDLVGPKTPKSLVLLADVIPSFIAKLTLPYTLASIPYPVRIRILIILSTSGLLIVAFSPAYNDTVRGVEGGLGIKLTGIVLASLSSGIGEMTFLGLTSWYGNWALAAWGSGTGGAGLVGAGMYAFATNVVGLGSRTTLLLSSALPLVFVVVFWGVLPRGVLKRGKKVRRRDVGGDEEGERVQRDDEGAEETADESDLTASVDSKTALLSGRPGQRVRSSSWLSNLATNIRRSKTLFMP